VKTPVGSRLFAVLALLSNLSAFALGACDGESAGGGETPLGDAGAAQPDADPHTPPSGDAADAQPSGDAAHAQPQRTACGLPAALADDFDDRATPSSAAWPEASLGVGAKLDDKIYKSPPQSLWLAAPAGDTARTGPWLRSQLATGAKKRGCIELDVAVTPGAGNWGPSAVLDYVELARIEPGAVDSYVAVRYRDAQIALVFAGFAEGGRVEEEIGKLPMPSGFAHVTLETTWSDTALGTKMTVDGTAIERPSPTLPAGAVVAASSLFTVGAISRGIAPGADARLDNVRIAVE